MGVGIASRQALSPSVAATLDVLAAEIELAGARCIFLDRVIGEVMDRLSDDDRERMLQGLHGVDLLAQHLTSLSAFTRTMSLAAPADLTLPVNAAIAEITLGALAERMTAGLGGADDDATDDADTGDVDMF